MYKQISAPWSQSKKREMFGIGVILLIFSCIAGIVASNITGVISWVIGILAAINLVVGVYLLARSYDLGSDNKLK